MLSLGRRYRLPTKEKCRGIAVAQPSIVFRHQDAGQDLHRERMAWLLATLGKASRTDPSTIPIAAALYSPQGERIAHGLNSNQSCLQHAEIAVLAEAQRSLGVKRLDDGCLLYVTCEPCLMCLGAAMLSRVSKIIYGCRNEKFGAFTTTGSGAAGSNSSSPFRGIHKLEVVGGVMEAEAAAFLQDFFRKKREQESKSGLNKPEESLGRYH
jgi:tRNA(adenine34) deaminase